MTPSKANRNTQQDIEIVKLHTKFDALKERFDSFLENDFNHLRNNVERIEWEILIGVALAILTFLLSRILI